VVEENSRAGKECSEVEK